MIAKHLSITNLRAFDSFEADLPSVAILSGQHGSGKSSIEEILKYALGRRPMADKGSRGVEHDPTMLRMGAEKGEAIITFSDDSAVELLRVAVAPDSTIRQIKTRGSKKWVAAASEIDAFAEAISYDPMVLKTLSARDRVAALLKVMPIEIASDEIKKALGDVAPHEAPAWGIGVIRLLQATPSLDTINQIHSELESQRRDLNRDAKSLSAHADELESALPPVAPDADWATTAAQLETEIAAIKKTETDLIQRLTKEGGDLKIAEANKRSVAHTNIDANIDTQIAALNSQRQMAKQVATDAELNGKNISVGSFRDRLPGWIRQIRAKRHDPSLFGGGYLRSSFFSFLRSSRTLSLDWTRLCGCISGTCSAHLRKGFFLARGQLALVLFLSLESTPFRACLSFYWCYLCEGNRP